MSQEAFGKLCNARGIDMDVARLFRACDRRHHGQAKKAGEELDADVSLLPFPDALSFFNVLQAHG